MGKWNKIFIGLIALTAVMPARSQTLFITSGRIEFERKIKHLALIGEDNAFYEHRKTLPPFITAYYNLTFNTEQALYGPGRQPENTLEKMYGIFDAENIVATHFNNFTSITQKTILGQDNLIADTLSKIKWKIVSELRTIAGFNCRKAVGKIFDSVIVIAFYTDEITPRGGPESFCGLPGMILGVAIPRLHTTWYATKVELLEVKSIDLAPP